ncbi:non-homologous end-joining factor 1 [Tachyglossus aculeatus]|uniref:non-homologous end-joining factor 1 n=1 Tax=Tachyglossus aculeatus TaxID=9261 RepID=UPI0018F689FD|nr:non-homologous end-joining factor 1 [Tachyglossus aculeatus]
MEEPEDDLLCRPWAWLQLPGDSLLAKAHFTDRGYTLLLCDLQHAWLERVDSDLVSRRAKELNKRLTAPPAAFLSRLDGLLRSALGDGGDPHPGGDPRPGQSPPETTFRCARAAGTLTLSVGSQLAGLPFRWDFHCAPAPSSLVFEQLVRPLMGMSLALQSQVRELAGLLRLKDTQIQDYEDGGATLSRDRLKTEPFDEDAFQEQFVAERFPAACSWRDGRPLAHGLQPLYGAVTAAEVAAAPRRRPDAPGDDHSPEPDDDEAAPQPGNSPPSVPAQASPEALLTLQSPPMPPPRPRPLKVRAKKKKPQGLFR